MGKSILERLRDRFRPKAVLPMDAVELLHALVIRGNVDLCDYCQFHWKRDIGSDKCLPDCAMKRWRAQRLSLSLAEIKRVYQKLKDGMEFELHVGGGENNGPQ